MSSTSVSAPQSFVGFGTAGVTQTTIFQLQQLERVMMSDVDVEQFGLTGLSGDLTESGSDTLSSVAIDGIGANQQFSALATETSAPVPSAYTLIVDAVTVGMYGWSNQQTFKGMMLGAPGRIATMEDLINSIPAMYRATVTDLVAAAIATITTAVGSASTTLSVDDLLDLVAAIEQTPGANASGMPKLMLHSVQLSQLKASMRTEPAFKEALATFVASQGVFPDVSPNFVGMGMDLLKSDKIDISGSAYQGGCVSPGTIALARARFDGVLRSFAALGQSPISGIADNSRGIFLFTSASGAASQIIGLNAYLMVGVALLAATRKFQRRLISST